MKSEPGTGVSAGETLWHRAQSFPSLLGYLWDFALLTGYLWDSDLLAAAAVAAVAEGFDLDDIILIKGQGQLHGGFICFYDRRAALPVPPVQHLQQRERERGQKGQSCSFSSELSRAAAALFLPLMLGQGLVTQGTRGICWGHQHRGGSAWAGG